MNKTLQFNKHPELIYFLQGFLFLSINIVLLISTNLIGYILLAIGFSKGSKYYPASSITLCMLLIFVSIANLFLPYTSYPMIDLFIGAIILSFRLILTKYTVDAILNIEKETDINLFGKDLQFLYKILLVSSLLSFSSTFVKSLAIPFAIAGTIGSILFFLGFYKSYRAYSIVEKNTDIPENKHSNQHAPVKRDKKTVAMFIAGGVLLAALLLIGIY